MRSVSMVSYLCALCVVAMMFTGCACTNKLNRMQSCGSNSVSDCGASDCGASDCGASDCGASDCGASNCGASDCGSCRPLRARRATARQSECGTINFGDGMPAGFSPAPSMSSDGNCNTTCSTCPGAGLRGRGAMAGGSGDCGCSDCGGRLGRANRSGGLLGRLSSKGSGDNGMAMRLSEMGSECGGQAADGGDCGCNRCRLGSRVSAGASGGGLRGRAAMAGGSGDCGCSDCGGRLGRASGSGGLLGRLSSKGSGDNAIAMRQSEMGSEYDDQAPDADGGDCGCNRCRLGSRVSAGAGASGGGLLGRLGCDKDGRCDSDIALAGGQFGRGRVAQAGGLIGAGPGCGRPGGCGQPGGCGRPGGCGTGGLHSRMSGRFGGGVLGGHTKPYSGAIPHTAAPPTFNGGPGGGGVPQYVYPYYTTRGPRDFLMSKPPSIGH